ncbi:MAG: hypothetical protein KKD63_06375 [Proteobacteria bacterium]|nr:hypothetical protein [Desulfobulbaceae bacterium]MBU4152487.1 hypothetical protein [Pseudomonadota bacterium]
MRISNQEDDAVQGLELGRRNDRDVAGKLLLSREEGGWRSQRDHGEGRKFGDTSISLMVM